MNRSARIYLSILQFAAAVALVVPFALKTYVQGFDDRPLRRLDEIRPTYVFVGNSMVESRIDTGVFAHAGVRAAWIKQDPTYPPTWYLLLKNYVAASAHRPRVVFLFFRDEELTFMNYDYSPFLLRKIARYRHLEEPVFDRLAFGRADDRWHRLALDQIANFYRTAGLDSDVTRTTWTRKLVDRFELLVHARHQTNQFIEHSGRRPAATGVERADVPRHNGLDFTASVSTSWLPAIVSVARSANLKLCFFRVKRAPQSRAEYDERSNRYVKEMRDWFHTQDVCFLDENDEPAITDDFYRAPADDHVADAKRPEYSRWFLENIARRVP